MPEYFINVDIVVFDPEPITIFSDLVPLVPVTPIKDENIIEIINNYKVDPDFVKKILSDHNLYDKIAEVFKTKIEIRIHTNSIYEYVTVTI